MATQNIKINVNLDALRGELLGSLQTSIYLIGAELQTKHQIEPELLRLSTGIEMTFDGGLTWDSEEAQRQYSDWILSNGFRDVIEDVSAFLESAHRVLSLWEIAGKQKEGADIIGSDWNEIVVSGPRKFHRLGFPDKLEHLRKNHGIEADVEFTAQVLTINAARNCLVHRGGVVAEKDLNNDNVLEVKWTKLMMVLHTE